MGIDSSWGYAERLIAVLVQPGFLWAGGSSESQKRAGHLEWWEWSWWNGRRKIMALHRYIVLPGPVLLCELCFCVLNWKDLEMIVFWINLSEEMSMMLPSGCLQMNQNCFKVWITDTNEAINEEGHWVSEHIYFTLDMFVFKCVDATTYFCVSNFHIRAVWSG